MYVCMYVYIYTHTHTHICMCMYMCVCAHVGLVVCVCRERHMRVHKRILNLMVQVGRYALQILTFNFKSNGWYWKSLFLGTKKQRKLWNSIEGLEAETSTFSTPLIMPNSSSFCLSPSLLSSSLSHQRLVALSFACSGNRAGLAIVSIWLDHGILSDAVSCSSSPKLGQATIVVPSNSTQPSTVVASAFTVAQPLTSKIASDIFFWVPRGCPNCNLGIILWKLGKH